MTTLDHSDEVTQLLRVIEDALWSLRRGYAIDAEAILLSVIEKERLRKDYKGPHITYLR